ncbi:hypothetical protein AB4Z38_25225 [Arthrobacter sp. 2RAF6]|uniref:hypothetical protein n=1 Tax=Arthrobacter sp. 2RAF6 TaxID=3233002 RepID=UPI003F90AC85
MTILSSATAHLAKSPLPLYDRSQVTPGIMHFGFGAFHRAHQAEYHLHTNPAFIRAVTDASQNIHDQGIETAIALQAYQGEASS